MISGQQEGMQTIEMDLARLVASGIISFETAAECQRLPEGDHGAGGDAAVADAGAGDGCRRPGGNDRLRPTHRRLTAAFVMVASKLPYKMLGRHRAVPGRLADPAGAPRRRDGHRRGADGRSQT